MKAKTRRRHLERMRPYVAVLQPLLRLQAWAITVVDAPPEGAGNFAECARFRDGYWARVYFSDGLFRESLAFQRATVVRELLHLHTHDWHVASVQAFEGLEQTSKAWARERHDHEHERCIDALALVLAPFLPLPPA